MCNNKFMTDITYLIRPKSVPLRSIAVTKIDQNMPCHDMLCPCDMCNKYEAKKVGQIIQSKTRQINEKIANRIKYKHKLVTPYYLWLIKHLVIPHNKIITKGIQIFISEILFYKQGQANNLFCCKQIEEPIIKRAQKQKLTNPFILKIFGDRRRKYRELINTFLGRKKEVVVKKPSFGKKQTKRQSKDGVIIKYVDGLEQLISQNQFLHLLQKRKQDPFWKQIFYIKNYIPVEDSMNRILVAKFDRSDIKYEQMFQRTQILMKIYGQNIHQGDKNYFSQEQQIKFCQSLQKQSIQIYCQYMLYKIVSYVNYFYDQKINTIVVKFLINEMGQCFLEDVMKLSNQSLIKFQWTNDAYLRKIDQQEQRVFFSKSVKVDEVIQRNAIQIQKQMVKNYERMKQFYGLSMVEDDNAQQRANNQFFRKIHPEIQTPISELLKSQGMTVNKFKRDFLGYKPQKKPIFKPFTSNLIKSLHNLTPQLRRADPHQYVKIPKRTLSTAFSYTSSCKRKNYSFTRECNKTTSNFVTALSTPRDQ